MEASIEIESIKSKLLSRIQKSKGCWNWTGAKGTKGYGQTYVSERKNSFRSHRVSYEVFCGEIPKGMCVLHRCDNPPCINPKHLFLGTPKDNTRDMINKGRSALNFELGWAKNRNRTHCPQGHPYSGKNLYLNKSSAYNERVCKECSRASNRRWIARKKLQAHKTRRGKSC